MRSMPEMLFPAVAALALGACAHANGGTGLNRGIADFAPSYVAMQPATADPSLGRRLRNGQPEVNRCFLGDTLVRNYPGATSVEIDYTNAADAALSADFGPLVTVGAGGATSGAVHITLADVTLTRLDRLFFDGAGNCANIGATEFGAQSEHRVVTRALKAGSVRIAWESGTSGQLGLNVREAGGSVRDSAQHDVAYDGTRLYFAYYPEKVQVTRTGVAGDTLGVGRTVDVGPCGFTLNAVQDRWQGRLSCQGGASFDLTEASGSYASVNVSPGVSYSVRVREGPGVARGTVDVWRYEVRTVQ
jgi:hypothetical protein